MSGWHSFCHATKAHTLDSFLFAGNKLHVGNIAIGILIPAGSSLEMFMGGIIASILEMRDPVIGEIKAFVAGGSVLGGGIAVLCQVFIVIAGGSPPMTVAFGGA